MSRASARGSGKHNSCPTLETERSETQSLGCASRGCDQAHRGGGVSGGGRPSCSSTPTRWRDEPEGRRGRGTLRAVCLHSRRSLNACACARVCAQTELNPF